MLCHDASHTPCSLPPHRGLAAGAASPGNAPPLPRVSRRFCLFIQTRPPGDLLDYATGALDIDNKRSAAAALAARGGAVNAPARDILSNFGVPILPGYSISLPLNGNHVMLRGTSDLDCLHYCSFGYSEIMIYELARQLRGGLAGVKPLSDAAAAAAAARPKRVCKPTPGTY